MHEYRRFIQQQLDERGWKPADLERKSGPSRQVVSRLLNDTRDYLGQMPDDSTIESFATSFGIPSELVRTAAARSLVGYVDEGEALTIQLQDVSTDVLLKEVRRRIDERQSISDQAAPAGAPREASEDEKTIRFIVLRYTPAESDEIVPGLSFEAAGEADALHELRRSLEFSGVVVEPSLDVSTIVTRQGNGVTLTTIVRDDERFEDREDVAIARLRRIAAQLTRSSADDGQSPASEFGPWLAGNDPGEVESPDNQAQ